MVFPMHFWENYDVFDSLFSDERTSRYRDRIVRISHRGEICVLVDVVKTKTMDLSLQKYCFRSDSFAKCAVAHKIIVGLYDTSNSSI